MKLLAVDPSSTCCGFAVVASADPRRGVLDAGIIKPPARPKNGQEDASGGGRRLANPDYLRRSYAMAWELIELVGPVRQTIELGLVETPAASLDRSRGPRRGQAIYGAAVAVILMLLREHLPFPVLAVPADVWTRQVGKDKRALWLKQNVPGYDPRKDTGLDAADAIELGFWGQIELSRLRCHVDADQADQKEPSTC